jgi:predicted site-specific integrase-resolvase
MSTMSTYTVTQFAGLIGKSVKTLQRWDRQGVLEAKRTPTNRRFYTDTDLNQVLKRPLVTSRKTVVYARVSSESQRPDLQNQRQVLEQFCIGRGLTVDEWVLEIGGGLNFKRPKLLTVIDDIMAGKVQRLVIAHKDRLARFGFDLIAHICECHECELLILNTESLSPEQEMVQDLMAITHCFSVRLYGLRNYRKALRKALHNDTSAPDSPEPHA